MNGPVGLLDAELRAQVEAWRDTDVDAATRAELDSLLATAASDPAAAGELRDAFAGPLTFGTAGLRGRLGAGPNRMNRAVVLRAGAGLAAWLRRRTDDPLVVVGFDARHGSTRFAHDTVEVLTAAGCRAVLLPGPLPTPVLAFAVRHLDADAGVMVTASHNPPADNGYKVYLGGRVATGPGAGVQLVSPADAEIATAIAAAAPASELPRAAAGWQESGPELLDAYVAATAGLAGPGPRELTVVATPLHGVGHATLDRVLTAAGFDSPLPVAGQVEPDPDFPTVSFPNPEEPGALDLALAEAARHAADLVVALDPDADRCAVAVPDPARGDRREVAAWRRLTGDELGSLLAEHLVARGRLHSPDPGEPATLACSLVSSSLLHAVARHHGIRSASTLTGFKWLARVPGVAFAYEEALGYCVDPRHVRDKDGIGTAVVVCELAASLASQGRSLLDALDDLALRHGVHATAPVTLRLADVGAAGRVLARLLTDPPAAVAGAAVTEVDDLATGVDGLPGTPGIRLRTADGARVVVRPSGTEPKLKAYLEVVEPVERVKPVEPVERVELVEPVVEPATDGDREPARPTQSAPLARARRAAAARLDELRAAVRALLDREG